MSFVKVVPSYTVKNITNAEGLILDRWEPAIKAGLTVGKVQCLEGFKVLAETRCTAVLGDSTSKSGRSQIMV